MAKAKKKLKALKGKKTLRAGEAGSVRGGAGRNTSDVALSKSKVADKAADAVRGYIMQ